MENDKFLKIQYNYFQSLIHTKRIKHIIKDMSPEDLASMTKFWFLMRKGIGRKSLKTISEALKKAGYIENAKEWREKDFDCPYCGKPLALLGYKRKLSKVE